MFLSPAEITEKVVESGCKKVEAPAYRLLLLGILAGAFIAFVSQGSNVAIHTIESVGIARLVSGALFSTGLMMVVVTGAELFTGNSLIIVSCLEGKSRVIGLLRNWFYVYVGNFIGAMIIVIFIILSGQLNFSNGILGGFTIKTASAKVSLSFVNGLFMGILCNWLVCMAVWMSWAATDLAGKLLAIFFPIWLFVTSGFEHSIANMYYIPAGILAKNNQAWAQAAIDLGVAPEKLEALRWDAFIVRNLIPVTLGNIIGGTIFVGTMYWLAFMYKRRQTANYGIGAQSEKLH